MTKTVEIYTDGACRGNPGPGGTYRHWDELSLNPPSGAQAAAIELLRQRIADGTPVTNREVDAAARDVIDAAGHGDHFGHGTGHGIGLATHELPSLGRAAPEAPLPSPTVFSVEPGVYLDGETGVRIEDLVTIDIDARSVELLTGFPRAITIVGD